MADTQNLQSQQRGVSRTIKQEASARDSLPNPAKQQAHEAAAFNSDEEENKGQQQSLKNKRRSPKKRLPKEEDSESDDEEDSEYYDDDFIVRDDEAEKELQGSAHILKKKKIKKRARVLKGDDEDIELIKENTGIQIKKRNRLKRNADNDDDSQIKREIEVTQDSHKRERNDEVIRIDTTDGIKKSSRADYKSEFNRTSHDTRDDSRVRKLRQETDDVYGRDLQPDSTIADYPMEEAFNADEIDDPFTTTYDKQVAEKDIPERLQIKLKDRMDPTNEELQEESNWVLERLSNYSVITTSQNGETEINHNYQRLLRQKDALGKIHKVLQLLRCGHFDVPFIVKYRKYEYADELDEEAIWIIFNLDQEYGKFQRHKRQIEDFLKRILQFEPEMKLYLDELKFTKSKSDLNDFNSLISYLRSYYNEQLQRQDETDQMSRRKQPLKRDEIQIAKQSKIENVASQFALSWAQFYENYEHKRLLHQPPQPQAQMKNILQPFLEFFPNIDSVQHSVVKFCAFELSAQPRLRKSIKEHLHENAYISTSLTDQGKKDLDLFNPSYRVKLVQKLPLKNLQYQIDLYLDIVQCEKSGLLKVDIAMDELKEQNFKDYLKSLYMIDPSNKEDKWNVLRTEIINVLVKILTQEITKEIREELKEEAETFVINKCKENYRQLLMTGPFTTKTASADDDRNPDDFEFESRDKLIKQHIKDRERNVVMGVLMHQIDAKNYVATVAVVDEYGELVENKDFMRLIQPRDNNRQQDKQKQGNDGRPIINRNDEQKPYEQEKERFIEMLVQYKVDLIVVAANCLEARLLKKSLNDIIINTKSSYKNTDDQTGKDKDQHEPKEALVIWGDTEVPKLFAMSHNSQRLHKGTSQMVKTAISLARFEQDPLFEILNLWSPITAENQALALNLDPMQKYVNQARLADSMEEVNVQVVNEIGVDLNLVTDHEHMQSVLQFVSGLGPRKAKVLLNRLKNLGRKLVTRGELYKDAKALGKEVYIIANGFLKIRMKEVRQGMIFDYLDQTRINHESYESAKKVCSDAYNAGGHDEKDQHVCVSKVIERPEYLNNLILDKYTNMVTSMNQQFFKLLIEFILQELKQPFNDPRKCRSADEPHIDNERLFYLLIDETKRTFKRGLIVTATVVREFESLAMCRLENGLKAIVHSSSCREDGLEVGHIVQGRIEKLVYEDEQKGFEVTLNCKKQNLRSHESYAKDLALSLGISPEKIDPADLINQNFTSESRPKNTGRFIPRRIAHEKFKNYSSRRAMAELDNSETGDFCFRPSTRSEDSITLTWKFWRKNFIHLDIIEKNKPPGAPIGSRLIISNDYYESLREIVERYIIPCNRYVREVVTHTKFLDADSFEDLEARLKEEKKEAPSRIPYRFAILPAYPQHIVLGYVPKDKVLKEFIKVRPKGFYFHDQTLVPFQNLINWFKDNWRTHEYQRHYRRAKSPRVYARPVQEQPNQSQVKQQMMPGQQDVSMQQSYSYDQWSGAPNRNSAAAGGQDNFDYPMKQERGYVKQEMGGKSPNQWASGQTGWNASGRDDHPMTGGNDAGWSGNRGGDSPSRDMSRGQGRGGGAGRSRACFKCQQEGHFAKDCPNEDTRPGAGRGRGGGRTCYKCNQPGHFAKECPEGGDGGHGGGRGGGFSQPDNGGFNQGESNNWASNNDNQNNDWNQTAGAGAGGGWQ